MNGNQVSFYHFDRSGSTLALTDGAGSRTDAYVYAPYGELLHHQGASDQPFTFAGQWGVRREGDSGMLYQMREWRRRRPGVPLRSGGNPLR